MHRRDFITKSCTACLSITATSMLATGCVATKYISGELGEDGLIVNKNEFKVKQRGGTAHSSFIIIRNDALSYPICLYRFDEQSFTALWMKCTHQGAELQASGDALQCPAHGSEFNSKGEVTNGPAGTNLRTFPVKASDSEVFIDLRKQL